MKMKTVRVSEKGQIAIPAEIRKEASIRRGDELLLFEDRGRILLQKAERVSRRAQGEFRGLLRHAEKVAAKMWSTPADDVWDNI